MPPSKPRSALHRLSLALILGCHASQPPCPTTSIDPASSLPPAVVHAATAITPDYLRAQIAKVSSDEFEGRGPATRGDRAARAYLIGQLAALGLEPGRGQGGWEQEVELVGVTAQMPAK